jgi:hypothetical protein
VIEVELPDGRVLEVDAPDAASAAVAARKFMGKGSAAAPSAAVSSAPQAAASQPRIPEFATSPAGQTPLADTRAAEYGAEGRRALQIGVQGVGSGLTKMIMSPFDLAAGAQNILVKGINAAAGTNIPMATPASDTVREGASHVMGAAGVPAIAEENMTPPEKLAYNVNDFGGQAAAAIPALVKAAASRAAQFAAGSAPKWFDSFLKPYMGETLGRTIAGDAAAAAGAGTAKFGADEYLPNEVGGYDIRPIKDTAAPIIGGVGGVTALNAGEALVRGIASAAGRPFGTNIEKSVNVDPETGRAFTKNEVDKAGEVVRRASAYGPNENIARIKDNRGEILKLDPYAPMPSPAALAEDPGLAGLERLAAMDAPGVAIARQREFASGVRDSIDRVTPQDGNTGALVDRIRKIADEQIAAADNRVGALERRGQRVQDIRQGDAENVTPYQGRGPEASARLDEQIVGNTPEGHVPGTGYLGARAEKNRLYEKGVPESTPVDLSGAGEAAKNVRAAAEAVPESIRSTVAEDLTNLGPTTYGTAKETRRALSAAEQRARANGDFGMSDKLRAVREPVQAEMNRTNPAAEKNYRENFAPMYRPGPGDEAAKFTRDIDRDPTRSTTPPSQTAGRFIQGGQPEKADALRRMIEGAADPAAAQVSAREYLLSDLASSGALDPKTEVLRPNRIRQWQQRYGAALDLAPGLKAEIDELAARAQRGEKLSGAIADQVRAAKRNLKATEDQIDKGAFGLVLGKDADKTVAAVMSDPYSSGKKLDELIRATEGDPQARNGLKAAVRDYIVEKATSNASEKLKPGDRRGPLSREKFANLFGEHEKELAKLYSPEDMNILRAGNRALDLAAIERVRVSSGSDTAEKSIVTKALETPLGKGIDAFLRVKYGVLKAGGLIATVKRVTSGNSFSADSDAAVQQLVRRATVDPELMGLLLGRKIPVGTPRWNAKLNQLMGYGEGARATGPDDEE